MSSKRVKRETVDLVTPDRSDHRNGTHVDTAAECDRLRKEVTHKNEVITALEEFVGKMQKGLCCGICTELLYQPFNLACGHVFCYTCLADWFKEAKRCPTCRERIVDKPAVSYLIKEMVNSIVRRSEIVDPEGTGARYYREQIAADQAVRDANGELFPGLFFKISHATNRIVDETDGVTRCIRCNWEVEGPSCMHCGLIFSDNEDGDFSDLDEDEEEDDSEDEDDEEDEDYEEDYYSPDEEYNIDPQSAASEALGYYTNPHSLWDDTHESWSSEEEEDEGEEDEDEDEEDDGEEEDSVMDTSVPAETDEPDEEEDDSVESIPYHARANNYYNHIDSSLAQDDDDDDTDDDEEEEPEIPRRSRNFFVVKTSDEEEEEEESDHTTRQTRSMRRGRNHVVDSDDE